MSLVGTATEPVGCYILNALASVPLRATAMLPLFARMADAALMQQLLFGERSLRERSLSERMFSQILQLSTNKNWSRSNEY